MSKEHQGVFISVEGIDEALAGDHIEWLRDHLVARGLTVVLTREPGGTELGEQLRELVLLNTMSNETELMLLLAARQEHLDVVIKPALARGDVVLCERFDDSTYAYQGGGRGIPSDLITRLKECCAGPRPQKTILLDASKLIDPPIPADIEAKDVDRMRSMRAPRVMIDRETAQFQTRVRNTYLALAAQHTERIHVVDVIKGNELVHAEITAALELDQPFDASHPLFFSAQEAESNEHRFAEAG